MFSFYKIKKGPLSKPSKYTRQGRETRGTTLINCKNSSLNPSKFRMGALCNDKA